MITLILVRISVTDLTPFEISTAPYTLWYIEKCKTLSSTYIINLHAIILSSHLTPFPFRQKNFLGNFLMYQSTANGLHFHFSENIFILPSFVTIFALNTKFQVDNWIFWHLKNVSPFYNLPCSWWKVTCHLYHCSTVYLFILSAFQIIFYLWFFSCFTLKCLRYGFLCIYLTWAR